MNYFRFSGTLFRAVLCAGLFTIGTAQAQTDPLAPLEAFDENRPGSTTNDHQVRALLEPKQKATLSSEMTGKIARMHKRDGERFRKGERLVTFDCSNARVEKKRLEAKLNSATFIYENALQLQRLNSIGELDVKLAEAETFVAKAELEAINLQIQRCVLNAPFNGRVIELERRQYEWTNIGEPLMEVFDDRQFVIRMLIPSSWLLWLQPGTQFEVFIDETGKNHQAKITEIGARIDPVSRTVTVRGVPLKHNKSFIHGMSGSAHFQPSASG